MKSLEQIFKISLFKRYRFEKKAIRIAILLIALISTSGIMTGYSQLDNPLVFEGNRLNEVEGDDEGLQTQQIIIKYSSGLERDVHFSANSPDQMLLISRTAGVNLSYFRPMSGNAHVLRLPGPLSGIEIQKIINKLEGLPGVVYAEPDLILRYHAVPDDTYYVEQWHYFEPTPGNYGINLPPAWDISTGSTSVVVAVIDTGITEHPEFVGRTVPGYDFISDVTTANDGDGRDADPSDPGDWYGRYDSSWHGTHTAGTVGAASNNGTGVAGVNWAAKILPVRVLGKRGGSISDIIDGMRWSAGLSVTGVPDNPYPAQVLNLSLGGAGACDSAMQSAVDDIIAAGSTIVVSAGNEDADASGYTPAGCSGVISVAATDHNGDRATYSNFGSVVDISAPGGDGDDYAKWILSTWNTGTEAPEDPAYAWMGGTSMSAPHVSGVASLLYGLDPFITPAEVLQILQETVTPFPVGSSCTTAICGSGILNAGAAMEAVIPTAVKLLSFVAESEDLSVTLNWTTVSEIDNMGFNIYRAETIDGERVKINSELILTQTPPGSQEGSTYTYFDFGADLSSGKLTADHVYYYWLEVIDIYDASILYGPLDVLVTSVRVPIIGDFDFYLPFIIY